jgi:nicotinamide-nucleotide adenylyltransferase
MSSALFIGRFQPLHKGHVRVIRNLLRKFEKVIVGIGSIDKRKTKKNPFTFFERKKMFEIVFGEEIKKGKLQIIGIRDEASDEKWTKKILKRVKFDVVVTGNSWVEECFSGVKPVVKIKLWKPEIYSATRIRALMKSCCEDWKKFVPEEIVEHLDKLLEKGVRACL